MNVAVIGAGAAGCFCAIALRRLLPDCAVTVYEAGPRPLRKVAVTGGGRCNLTNSFEGITRLQEAYPRGWQLMKRALGAFSAADTQAWFEREGVRLVTQPDGCVFPRSQDAMEIVRTLLRLMDRLGVEVRCNSKIGDIRTLEADAVVVTTGGGALQLLEGSGVAIEPPVPSLFTFNLGDDPVRTLAGTVVENASTALAGTKFRASGPLLVTDWGMSGPAILKLSSYGARYLSEQGYRAQLLVSWLGAQPDAEVRGRLETLLMENPRKQLSSVHPQELTAASAGEERCPRGPALRRSRPAQPLPAHGNPPARPLFRLRKEQIQGRIRNLRRRFARRRKPANPGEQKPARVVLRRRSA